jgi:hypothetical protein
VDDEVQTVDFVGMPEKRVDARAVEVLDRTEIDGDRPPRAAESASLWSKNWSAYTMARSLPTAGRARAQR